MGNKPSIKLSQPLQLAPLDWHQTITYDRRRILKHYSTHQQIEEFQMVIHQPEQLALEKKAFQLRLNSLVLVSSLYFKQTKTTELCSGYYKGSIYLESIALRLSQIDQVPHPDIVYLYKQVLFGFQELYSVYGAFRVSEDLVCVNKKAEVKVWCHAEIQRISPEASVSKNRITEEQMVYSIIQMVEKVGSKGGRLFNIGETLLKDSGHLSFKNATLKFESIVRKNQISVPTCLESLSKLLQKVGGADPFQVIKIREELKGDDKRVKTEGQAYEQQVHKDNVDAEKGRQNRVVVNLKEKKEQVTRKILPPPSSTHEIINQSNPGQHSEIKRYPSQFIRKPSLSTFNPTTQVNYQELPSINNSKTSAIVYHSRSNSKQTTQHPIQNVNNQQYAQHTRNNSRDSISISISNINRSNSFCHIQTKEQITYHPQAMINNTHQGSIGQPIPSNSKQLGRLPALHLELEPGVTPSPVFTPKNQSTLPTGASFEMNTTYTNNNKDRFITSPSNTSYTGMEHSCNNNGAWSPTNSQKVKKSMEMGVRTEAGTSSGQNQLRNSHRNPAETIKANNTSSLKQSQSINNRDPTQPSSFKIINNLSQQALKYLHPNPVPEHGSTKHHHLKSPSECLTSNSKTKQPNIDPSNPAVQQIQTMQLPQVEVSEELVNSMKSISFKKDKLANSFSFDDMQNLFDQKKERMMSRQEIEEFEKELSNEINEDSCGRGFKKQETAVRQEERQGAGLFEERQAEIFPAASHLFPAKSRPSYQRPKSTKGKYSEEHHSIQPRILRFNEMIPEVSLSQEEKSYATIVGKDISKDLMEVRERDSQLKSYYQSLNGESVISYQSLRSYGQQ